MESSKSKTMVGTRKSSHVISKINHDSCGGGGGASIQQSNNKITPTIRIVHIFAPKIIKTDPANFRALVQKLTGRKSGRPSKKSKQKKLKLNPALHQSTDFDKSIGQACPVENSQALSDGRHLSSKQPGQSEFMRCDNQCISAVKEESVEEDSMKLCEDFSGFSGGFGEMDIFNALMDSGSILPEFPAINPPQEQTDHFRPLETMGGFGQFYQQLPFQY